MIRPRVGEHGRAASVYGVFAALVLVAPVLAGIAYATAASLGVAGPAAGTATFSRIARVMTEQATWSGTMWSIEVAAASTTIATVIGVAAAVAFRRTTFAERIGRSVAALPLPVPYLIAAAAGVWLLGQSGIVGRIAFSMGWISRSSEMPAIIYDRYGIGLITVMAWKEASFLFVVATSLLAVGTGSAEEAARTLGAGTWATFRRVTWPVLWRGLAPALVSVFVFVMGNYEATALLAPSAPLALPLAIAERAADPDALRRADAYVLSLLLLIVGVAAVSLHELARARWERYEH